jgi:hypothetical protein
MLIIRVFARGRNAYNIVFFLVEVERRGSYEITVQALDCRHLMYLVLLLIYRTKLLSIYTSTWRHIITELPLHQANGLRR